MTLKNIAVEGLTLAHKAGSLISGGVFVVTSIPSTKVKAGGKFAYENSVKFTFVGGSASGFVAGSVATTVAQTINTSAVKCLPCTLEDDLVLMTATGTVGSTATPISGIVEISDAGQSVARGS